MSNHTVPTILFFDSGVGGLSVYLEVKEQLPNANYIYLFDNQAYPYGELDKNVLVARVNALVKQVIARHNVDIVVIACNTASTVVLPSLRESLDIPVVGVVPAIKPATIISTQAIGLIATPATVKREYTQNLIKDFATHSPVLSVGSTELVEMAERKIRGEQVLLDDVKKILTPLIGKIDVAVLGCTHFPLLKEEIAHVLGSKVHILDSGRAIANRVVCLIGNQAIVNHTRNDRLAIAYCSATPQEELALTVAFNAMGLNAIETIQIQGVSDR